MYDWVISLQTKEKISGVRMSALGDVLTSVSAVCDQPGPSSENVCCGLQSMSKRGTQHGEENIGIVK